MLLALVLGVAGCNKGKAKVAAGDGLVGIHISATGLPTLEVAVQTRPKVADKLVATTMAALLAKVFGQCAAVIDVKKSFPLQLEFASQGGAAKTRRKGAGPLEKCLFAAIEGKPLTGWGGNARVRLQIRPLAGPVK